MAIINPWTVGAVMTAGKAVWNGTKWVKKIKKLKRKTNVTAEKVKRAVDPRNQKPYRPTPTEEAKTVITQSAIGAGAVVGMFAATDSGPERAKKIRNKKKKGSQIAHKKYLREK